MKLTTEIVKEKVFFRIQEYDPKYEPVLKMCYYQKDETGYYKSYPSNYPDMETIRKNFEMYGLSMFDQLGYFKPVPWEQGLLAFMERMQGSGINWWLTGSGAVCARGIPLNPHDLDIMVDSKDVPKIIELFSDVLFEPIMDTHGWVTKDFGVLFLHCRIDIASDPAAFVDDPEPVDFGPYAKGHLETIEWHGRSLQIPPLSLSIAVNRKRERWERVKIIEDSYRIR